MEEKTQQTKTKFWKFQKQTYCEKLIYLRVSWAIFFVWDIGQGL